MIVVATGDFELYHAVVGELRDRGVTFTTIEPGEAVPARATVVISAATDGVSYETVEHVTTTADDARRGVEEALGLLRSDDERTVIGIDPGDRPGIAVLSGDRVVSVARVPVGEVAERVQSELDGEPDALVRIGDGARLHGARIVDALEDVPVELVDENGTTPSLGPGTSAAGMGDVLAAANIARIEGERVETYDPEPTPGEVRRIQTASRKRSDGARTIGRTLARRVARGELTLDEALAEHREA